MKLIGISSGNEVNQEIFKELERIESSEKGKLIDLDLIDREELEELEMEYIEKIVREEKLILFGGSHETEGKLLEYFSRNNKQDSKQSCLIVFDAHPGCGEKGWIRKLLGEGFSTENILLVGNRERTREEIVFLAEKKIRSVNINNLYNNLEEVTDVVMEFSSGKQLAVIFDIDIIDPAFANSSKESVGGISSRQAIYIISRIALMKNLRIFSLSGISESEDARTIKLSAKIISELL